MKKIGIIVMAALLLSGCVKENMLSDSFFAMDTVISVKACGDPSPARERITELENILSSEKEGSDIYRINRAEGKPVTVYEDTLQVISGAKYWGEKSDGGADITLYNISAQWGFFSGEHCIPSQEKISALLEKTGAENIVINGNEIILPEGFSLDLGAAAKGFAGDAAAEALKEKGVTSAVINLGGNVRVLGEKPDGSPWKIAVTDPFSPDEYYCTLSVKDCSVVTSGNYQRYFMGEDGKKYCHIIDPKTGCPADSGLASVTVIGSDGLACDLLSTAAFVLGKDGAEKLYRGNDGFELIMVTDSGGIFVTEGAAKIMTLADSDRCFTVIEK